MTSFDAAGNYHIFSYVETLRPYPLCYGYGRKCKSWYKLLKIKGFNFYVNFYGKWL